VSSIGRTVNRVAGRLVTRRRADSEGYVLCPNDGFWFRPSYTEGKCPLCAEVAPVGAAPLPLLLRSDRSWLGLGLLALESLGMMTLVLFMYFRG
jgi:hypothetical protein